MTKFSSAISGITSEHSENEILIDGASYVPIELIDIAIQWVGIARRNKWALLDPQGMKIDFDWYINDIIMQLAEDKGKGP